MSSPQRHPSKLGRLAYGPAVQRLILSRKGFDASAGGGDSPILPNGRMVSIPIPESRQVRPTARTRYSDLEVDGLDYLTLLRSLYPHRSFADGELAHLDPDLMAGVRRGRRLRAFRGLLGQAGTAAKHLSNQKVGPGDLFLFFGRFRAAAMAPNGSYSFLAGAPPFHAIFGYLEVGDRIDLPADGMQEKLFSSARAWAPEFPHFLPTHRSLPKAEAVFVATPRLSFAPSRPGFGLFRFRDELRLTRPDSELMSGWRLPASFNDVSLTYNPRTSKRDWRPRGDYVEFRAAGRGQEFVCEATPGIRRWAERLTMQAELW